MPFDEKDPADNSNAPNYLCSHCGQAIEETPYCMYCGAKQKGSSAPLQRAIPQSPWHGDDAESLARIPFSLEVEQKIEAKSKWMTFFAYAHYFVGVSLGIGALFGLVSEEIVIRILCLVITGIFLYEGHVLLKASHYFRLVAVTDEADQVYVAEGVKKLKSFFLLDSVFYGVILILLFFIERLSNG